VLGNLRVLGKVHANAPERIFDLIEDHRWFEGHHRDPSESTLRRVYFGVELSNFRDLKNRKFNLKFELPQRIYLGPTSTDNDLAFLMIHQCQIEAGDFVLDPFVGTGSLLIPAAYYGAHTFGSDLDIRVLNGYSVGKINKRAKYYDKDKGFELFTPKIMLPFRQYGLSEPEIFRMDCLHSRFLQREFFDAIVCDPPYGIRAMSRSTNK
jgi:tRNA (guanine10-N2)-methyltransferase